MKDVYIVSAKRTPIGKYRGMFKDKSAVELASTLLVASLNDLNIAPNKVDGVLMGNVIGAGLGENMARQVALKAGLDQATVATTINDVCGSSLKALRLAEGQMQMGDLDLVAVGGSESMTNAPFLVDKKYKENANEHLVASLFQDGLNDAFSGKPMGVTAENVAEKYHVTREEMDQFSLRSQQKATEAMKKNVFVDEIIPIEVDGQLIDKDESIRTDSTYEALASLKPVFKENGAVTAGNSSPINDGASMLILATAEKVKELNLQPIAKLGGFAEAGFDPELMGYTPYYAIKKLMQKTGRTLADYDVVELNEAFAAQAVAVARDLAIPETKLNPLGGAIALGHPLGATGTRLVVTAINALNKAEQKRALVSLCIGGGQAIAYEIELV